MAKKSKTQKAKAAAARAQKKAEQQAKELNKEEVVAEAAKETSSRKEKKASKKAATSTPAAEKKPAKKAEKEKPKKKRFKFLREVRAELKRVTWPSRKDVWRWSLVVVAALIFFGVFVLVLDNLIVTPFLVAFSGLGA